MKLVILEIDSELLQIVRDSLKWSILAFFWVTECV